MQASLQAEHKLSGPGLAAARVASNSEGMTACPCTSNNLALFCRTWQGATENMLDPKARVKHVVWDWGWLHASAGPPLTGWEQTCNTQLTLHHNAAHYYCIWSSCLLGLLLRM